MVVAQVCAVFLPVLAALGCAQGDCIVSTKAELQSAATNNSCLTITIQKSNLTDLSGIEQLARSCDVSLIDNAALTDVSAIQHYSGALDFHGNTALKRIDVGVVDARIHIFEETPSVTSVTIAATHSCSFDYDAGPNETRLRSIEIDCPTAGCAAAEFSENAGGIGGTIAGGPFTTLGLGGTIFQDTSYLELFGIATKQVALDVQVQQVVTEYRQFLDDGGFAGTFSACTITDVSADPSTCTAVD